MRILVQRCDKANVTVDNKIVGSIDKGMMILVGFTETDTSENIDYMVDKVLNLRIYDDENGDKINKYVYIKQLDSLGEIIYNLEPQKDSVSYKIIKRITVNE